MLSAALRWPYLGWTYWIVGYKCLAALDSTGHYMGRAAPFNLGSDYRRRSLGPGHSGWSYNLAVLFGLDLVGFVLFLAVTTKEWFLIARQSIVGLLIGVALSAVQLLPFLQLSQYVARSASNSFEFATAFSLPVQQLATLAVPDFFGDPVTGYWGAPYFEELTFYAGILALLGLLFIFRRPGRRYWFFLLAGAGGILLALGSNTFVYEWLYEFFMPIRLLRGPGRAGVIYVFASAALLGEILSYRRAIEDSNEGKWARNWLRILLSAILTPWHYCRCCCCHEACRSEIPRSDHAGSNSALRHFSGAFFGLYWFVLDLVVNQKQPLHKYAHALGDIANGRNPH